MRDHPIIESLERTGLVNMAAQSEHAGIDYFGNEILVGDEIIVTPDGDTILSDSLEDYLIEVLGFEYKQAE